MSTGEGIAFLPEVPLLAGALVALVDGSFTTREAQWHVRLLEWWPRPSRGASGLGGDGAGVLGNVHVDTATGVVRPVGVASRLMVVGVSIQEVAGHRQGSGSYALLLLSATGAVVIGGAADLLGVVVRFCW